VLCDTVARASSSEVEPARSCDWAVGDIRRSNGLLAWNGPTYRCVSIASAARPLPLLGCRNEGATEGARDGG
jgi:hypothetical protein